MITHDEKAFLHCRIDSIMRVLAEIVDEMSKWQTETTTTTNEGNKQ
jgi:hypothetical protein